MRVLIVCPALAASMAQGISRRHAGACAGRSALGA
jgi:hypothetical protein